MTHGAPLLDPQLLRSFVAIVEIRCSFTRRRRAGPPTQSTLSQQMRRLEQQLGCTLLDRPAARWPRPRGDPARPGALHPGAAARRERAGGEGEPAPCALGVPEDFAAGP